VATPIQQGQQLLPPAIVATYGTTMPSVQHHVTHNLQFHAHMKYYAGGDTHTAGPAIVAAYGTRHQCIICCCSLVASE